MAAPMKRLGMLIKYGTCVISRPKVGLFYEPFRRNMVLCERCFSSSLNLFTSGLESNDHTQDKTDNQESISNNETSDYFSSNYDQIYPGHIATSDFQKGLLAVTSAFMSLYKPARDDMISVLGETTGHRALIYMQKKMMDDPVGQKILSERPRINSRTVDLEYLKELPEETFGKAYSNFLHKYKCDPDLRRQVQFVDDPDLAYVMQRYREVHDLLHTVLGMPTNLLGEIVVKWIEALQLGLPMAVLGALFGPMRFYYYPKHRRKFLETHLQWAIRNGTKANFLLNVYYEEEWETSLDDLRHRLNIEPPPPT